MQQLITVIVLGWLEVSRSTTCKLRRCLRTIYSRKLPTSFESIIYSDLQSCRQHPCPTCLQSTAPEGCDLSQFSFYSRLPCCGYGSLPLVCSTQICLSCGLHRHIVVKGTYPISVHTDRTSLLQVGLKSPSLDNERFGERYTNQKSNEAISIILNRR